MTTHSYPVNDLIEHELRCDACVCGPALEFTDGGLLVIHHSLDGRELHEPDHDHDQDEAE